MKGTGTFRCLFDHVILRNFLQSYLLKELAAVIFVLYPGIGALVRCFVTNNSYYIVDGEEGAEPSLFIDFTFISFR